MGESKFRAHPDRVDLLKAVAGPGSLDERCRRLYPYVYELVRPMNEEELIEMGLKTMRRHNRLPGTPCAFAIFMPKLSRPRRALIERALGDNDIQAKAIYRTLAEDWKIKVNYNTVKKHRRGDCSCSQRNA